MTKKCDWTGQKEGQKANRLISRDLLKSANLKRDGPNTIYFYVELWMTYDEQKFIVDLQCSVIFYVYYMSIKCYIFLCNLELGQTYGNVGAQF